MATLMHVTLELHGPDDVATGVDAPADRREVESGVRTMALGGIDGMLAAVNAVIGPQGYELRRQLADQ
jgi:hypothetical protein